MKTYVVGALAVVIFTTPSIFAKDNVRNEKAMAVQVVMPEQPARPDHKVKRDEKKARLEASKQERTHKGEEAKKAREDKRAERKAASEKADSDGSEIREKKSLDTTEGQDIASDKADGDSSEKREKKSMDAAKGQDIVDNREARQDKRIQHGISKGYLTEDEVTKLEAQQESIKTLESTLTSDGAMSRQDFRQLTEELNTASHCIWGEKHDTDGKQMAAYRFGSNVFAKNDLTAKMSDPNLSKAEARTICKDFHRMMDLKKQLSGNLSGEDREKLQAQYDELLNQYFEVK